MARDARQVKLALWKAHVRTNLQYLPFLNCSVDREQWPRRTSQALRGDVRAFPCRARMTPSEDRNHYVTWKIVLYNNLNTHKKRCIPANCFSVKDEIRKISKASYLPNLAERYTMRWSWANPVRYYDSA